MSLPKKLQYASRIESAMAKSYTAHIQPQGSTSGYTQGTVCTINIPTRTNLALVTQESYLKFTATPTGTAAKNARLDSCGAHGYISRLRIWSGSNLKEDITSYSMLAKIFFDLQLSSDATAGKQSILSGTKSDLNCNFANTVIDAVTLPNLVLSLNSGNLVAKSINNGELLTTAVKRTYCISLLSILGTLSEKYYPLFAETSAPVRLEIQFASSAYEVYGTDASVTGFTIDDISYVGSFIELSDQAMGTIVNTLQGRPLQYSMNSFSNYQFSTTLAASSTTIVNMPIPAKFVSLKALIVSMRNTATSVNAATYFPLSSVNPNQCNLTSYQFRVGSTIMPSIAPTSPAQYFAELIKTVGSISDLNSNPSIDQNSYVNTVNTAMTGLTVVSGIVQSNSFYIGIDLENYQGADKSQTYSGWNSSTDDIYLMMTFLNETTAAINMRFDAFAMFDQEVIAENNTSYVKF